MKRSISILFILLVLPSTVFSEGKKFETLNLVNSSTFYPYSFLDESGKPAGILIDLWKLWGERNGVQVRFNLLPWNESLKMIENREADIHSGLLFSEERDRFIDFESLELRLDSGLYIEKKSSLKDMKYLSFAGNKGDRSVEIVRKKYPGINLKVYNNDIEAMTSLRLRKVHGWISDIPTAVYFFNRYNLIGEYKLAEVIYSKKMSYGVQEGNDELREFVKKGYGKISSREIEDIYDKWIHYEQSDYFIKIFIKAILGIVFLSGIFFFVINYFLLRIRVRKRTIELEKSLKKIKILSGFLPICVKCKKIRDDEGFWQQIEKYISENSEAEFSHSICPECSDDLYGDLLSYDKKG